MDSVTESNIIRNMEVASAIKGLPVKQQVIIAMHIAGYKQNQSACILGTTRAAAGYNLKKAREALTKCLKSTDV